MKNIGNIIIDSNVTINRFNILTDYTQRDINLPTLIVGYKKTLELFPDYKFKYKDNKIKDNVYWTYSKGEKRSLYQTELYDFKVLSYNFLINKFNYYFVDFVTTEATKLHKIINKIKSSDKLILCEYDKGFFILYNNTVLGFNFENIKFSGNDIEKLKKHILTSNNIVNCNITEYDADVIFFNDEFKIPILCGFDNNFYKF